MSHRHYLPKSLKYGTSRAAWRLRFTALALGASILAGPAAHAEAGRSKDIPWRTDVSFTRTSADDDIKNVLRAVLRADGLSVIFRPGVTGTVFFRFEDMPLQAAFEQLIEEHGLGYNYNRDTRTVTVFAKTDKEAAGDQTFISLGDMDYGTVRAALANFGIGTAGIAYDPGTKLLAVSGDQQRVDSVSHLVETLKQQGQARSQKDVELRKQELASHAQAVQQKVYDDLVNWQVKVIPLRFADVGPTTKEFQGKTVTVPGIADTLEAMVGKIEPKALAAGAGNTSGTDEASGNGKESLAGLRDLQRPMISIDQRSNSVIVRGTPEAIAQIEKVIQQLDRPQQMVQIEVVIATAQAGVTEELGVSWRGSGAGSRGPDHSGAIDTGTSGGRVTGGAGGVLSSNGFDAISLLPQAALGSTVASFVMRAGNGFIQAQLHALAEKNKARILSAPRLVTLDNIAARITRSQNIFVQVHTGALLDGVGLEEIKTGLTLDITPSVIPPTDPGSEPLIRLNLSAENSAPGSGSFGQIDVRSQQVQTQVLVPDGATFVIGGLFDDTRRDGQDGIPLLKDIPGLGRAFRTDTSEKSLGETVFFITPHLVDQRQFVPADVATRFGSERYIEHQREILDNVSRQMDEGTGGRFPNSVRTLEEDE